MWFGFVVSLVICFIFAFTDCLSFGFDSAFGFACVGLFACIALLVWLIAFCYLVY